MIPVLGHVLGLHGIERMLSPQETPFHPPNLLIYFNVDLILIVDDAINCIGFRFLENLFFIYTVDVYNWKYGGPHIVITICANEMKLCVYNA